MPNVKQLETHSSNPYSIFPLNIKEILISKDQSTCALIKAKDELLADRDVRISEQSDKISEQSLLMQQQSQKLTEASNRLVLVDEYLLTISRLEGQLENLKSSYSALKNEYDQLLVILADFTSPKSKASTLRMPIPFMQSLPEKVANASPEKILNTSPLSISKGTFSSVLPFLWKVVPGSMVSKSDTEIGSPTKESTLDSSMSSEFIDSKIMNDHFDTMSSDIKNQEHLYNIPQRNSPQDLAVNFNSSPLTSHQPIVSDTQPIEFQQLFEGNTGHSYNHLSYHSDSHPTTNPMPLVQTNEVNYQPAHEALLQPNTSSNNQHYVPPPFQIHPYYMNMNYDRISFENSLGFVPQPETDY